MKTTIPILFLALLCISCESPMDADTIIYGKVIEMPSNKPLENCPVALQYDDRDVSFAGFDFAHDVYSEGVSTTNKNGDYVFAFVADKKMPAEAIYRFLFTSRFWAENQDTLATTLKHKSSEINLFVYRKIDVIIKFIPPSDANNTDKYSVSVATSIASYWRFSESKSLQEIQLNPNLHRVLLENVPTKITYQRNRNGIWEPAKTTTISFNSSNKEYNVLF
ncbi:MAG: hypothetical protein ACKVTZ_05790 [Bacteroidia bacterium]